MLAAKNVSRVSTPSVRSRRCIVRVAEYTEPATSKSAKHAPLIQRLGGPTGVRTAVDIFYKKVLADSRVNHYFTNTNMEKLRAHQAAFMTYAFGGEDRYRGKNMVEAHRHLLPHLEHSHFDAIVEHFVATLNELEVGQADIDEACGVVETTRDVIVNSWRK